MTALEGIAIDTRLTIKWWEEPADCAGHDPRSIYVERFWLPILGPSATLMMRYFSGRLALHPGGVTLDLGETPRMLGLGDRTGRHAPFMRTLARTVDFHMTKVLEPELLGVRRQLPSLSRRNLARLPESYRLAHTRILERRAANAPTGELRHSADRLAASLLALGETEQEVVTQLISWRFDASLARESVRRAVHGRL